jgi:Cytochrome b5-like Heme/Steroid binding domain
MADATAQVPVLSSEQLLQHDGVEKGTVYVCLQGKVYDVSESAGMYGPGGRYSGTWARAWCLCLTLCQWQISLMP